MRLSQFLLCGVLATDKPQLDRGIGSNQNDDKIGYRTLDWASGELDVNNWNQVNWENNERGAMMRSRRNNQIRKQLEGKTGTSGANRKGNYKTRFKKLFLFNYLRNFTLLLARG